MTQQAPKPTQDELLTPKRRRDNYEAQKRWARNNPEKVRAIKARFRERHAARIAAERREYRKQHRAELEARKLQWALDNPDRVAASRATAKLKRQYGKLRTDLAWRHNVTVDDYLDLLAKQGGRCAICFSEHGDKDKSRLFLDHDHKTGQVRGLLCNRCNSSLGYMNDSPWRLRRAADYLEKARRHAGHSPAEGTNQGTLELLRRDAQGRVRRPSGHSVGERREADRDALAVAR